MSWGREHIHRDDDLETKDIAQENIRCDIRDDDDNGHYHTNMNHVRGFWHGERVCFEILSFLQMVPFEGLEGIRR